MLCGTDYANCETKQFIVTLCMHFKYRLLGECILISSLPGNALRTLVDIASNSSCVLKTEPGKHDVWYSVYQFTYCFTRRTSDCDVFFDMCDDSAS